MSVDLTALVANAFKVVGTAVPGATRGVTYRAAGEQAYDPATGLMTTSYTDYPVEATLTAFKRITKENDFGSNIRQEIEYGDQKCLIPYADLPITPTMEDVIVDGSKVWRVINFGADPTGKALHLFHLRQS